MWVLKIAKQSKAHFALEFCLPPGEQILIILGEFYSAYKTHLWKGPFNKRVFVERAVCATHEAGCSGEEPGHRSPMQPCLEPDCSVSAMHINETHRQPQACVCSEPARSPRQADFRN